MGEMTMGEERNQILISYSHNDGKAFVDRLVDTLEVNKVKTWVDSDDIEPGSIWNERIKKAIEKVDNFIFVISPGSINSKYCLEELEYAVRNGKKVLPIAIKRLDPGSTPQELSRRQWTYFEDQVDDFHKNVIKLVEAIKTDLEWKEIHSNLQNDALDWEKSGCADVSILLRDKKLKDAEGWLARIGPAEIEPRPTPLQSKFVLASREQETRLQNEENDRQKREIASQKRQIELQRRIRTIISIALVLVGGLAIVAFILRGVAASEADMRATAQVKAEFAEKTAVAERDLKATEQVKAVNAERTAVAERDLKATAQVIAETQRDLAISRQLAAQAQLLKADHQLDLGLLLAIEASYGSSDGLLSLSNLLQAEPGLFRIVSGVDGYIWQGADVGFIDRLALSPDGFQLVAQSYLGEMFWDLNSGQSQSLDAGQYDQYWIDWSPYQEPAPVEEEQFLVLDVDRFIGPSTQASNRKAFSACRTRPSAGGAPGCASLIYIFEPGYNPLVTPLAGCNPNAAPPDFSVELEGGLFCISGVQTTDFELYSVALANKATNNGSLLAGVLYDPRHNWLVTAAAVERHFSELALIVWDLNEKKQVVELFTGLWGSSLAKINFSSAGSAVDVCVEGGASIQVDINPDSWREKACKIAGRNMTTVEWQHFFGDKPYHQTCPQWP